MRQAERQQAFVERALGRRLLAPHAKAALAVEHLALPSDRFFAVATTSERKPVGAPVGSLRSAADATEMPSSSPIMWIGR